MTDQHTYQGKPPTDWIDASKDQEVFLVQECPNATPSTVVMKDDRGREAEALGVMMKLRGVPSKGEPPREETERAVFIEGNALIAFYVLLKEHFHEFVKEMIGKGQLDPIRARLNIIYDSVVFVDEDGNEIKVDSPQ